MNYTTFAEGELTIYCGENARMNSHASLKQAAALATEKRRGRILYINTFLSNRKLLASKRLFVPESESNIIFYNVEIGELASRLWDIGRIIREQNIRCVIINSWEFAHKSYIHKEKA